MDSCFITKWHPSSVDKTNSEKEKWIKKKQYLVLDKCIIWSGVGYYSFRIVIVQIINLYLFTCYLLSLSYYLLRGLSSYLRSSHMISVFTEHVDSILSCSSSLHVNIHSVYFGETCPLGVNEAWRKGCCQLASMSPTG